MPATQTSPTLTDINAFAVATLAATTTTRNIEWKRNDGSVEMVEATPSVTLYTGVLRIILPENAIIDATTCRSVLTAARKAVLEALETAGIQAEGVTWAVKGKSKRGALHLVGDWMHGQFWTSGRYAEIRILGAK